MDFYYEHQTPVETPSAGTPAPKDEKTNEVFSKFENELSSAYDKTAQSIKTIMNDDDKEDISLNLPIDEATSRKAQEILTSMDENLAKVENMATSYWDTVKTSGFWSNITENLGSQFDKAVQITSESLSTGHTEGNSSTVNTQTIAGNRTEAELSELSTNKEIYLKIGKDKGEYLDIDSKTEEISDILKSNKELEILMNSLVPQQISYVDFWNIYLNKRDEILKREETRKNILTASSQNKKVEEEINWDDEDEHAENDEKVREKNEKSTNEEDIGNESSTSTKDESLVIVSKSDIKEEENKTNEKEENDDDEEQEDDDDWE
ncbi:similar to Saccharomyces cerevisiae YDR068W DOS2 Protein of unknown function, green fluorescent protein (GFP)-fusion protein localizes to the cytoplasm [Maudiozyma barnettii]|uniref:BSD domain-containing protein n=1 Tax=Maudiozyma barnettii TaxID=61262 RepID=A0A8H2VIY6_9SACH|nr:Dos2p [Kazachstania barnettii]CAB4256586.1 similar to Saccharomyces cerevisiae YDR068W DOS2 Protein of unknown function, green fluorescent protein (GFP)-fusion protein localizes to the cytoplasm [Kazachstania barnettii]CAD1785189.1 similar to Saccharomyces cerevisiae YDR068W DOS2 Protein of unknown function, green fluorescent protein (GFP)-fusion protein localizes to the cytoplasm [Kazachstania barnettii]